jgi:hypothetical protein
VKKKDLVIGIIFLCISGIFFVATYSFPKPPVQAAGPSFWPKLMSVFLAIFSLTLILTSLKKPINVKNEDNEKSEHRVINEEKEGFRRSLIGILMTGFFILALNFFGFILGTIGYYLSIKVLVSKKYTWKNLMFALVQATLLTALIYISFGEFLNVNLPTGIIFK